MSSSIPLQGSAQSPLEDATSLWFEPRKDPHSAEEKVKARRLIQKMTRSLESFELAKGKPSSRKKVQRAQLQERKIILKINIRPLLRQKNATAKLGMFSKDLYEQGHIGVQRSELCKLPIEIVTMVLKKLVHPDKTALALTCKDMMGKVETQRQSAQKITRKRASVSKTQRLAVLVRLRDWVPSELKLCYSCVKYLPRASTGQWVGDKSIVDSKSASQKAIDFGPRCETCRNRDRIAAVSAGAEAQKLYRLARSHIR